MKKLIIHSFVALAFFSCFAAVAQDRVSTGDNARDVLDTPSESSRKGDPDKSISTDKNGTGIESEVPVSRGTSESSAGALPEVTLLSSDNGGLVFDVGFTLPEPREVSKTGRVFTEYDFPGCNKYGDLGEPAIYRKNIWIAVPENAAIDITVEKGNATIIRDVMLNPVPDYAYKERDGIGYYAEEFSFNTEAYSGKNLYGTDTAEITNSGRFRGYKIIVVGVTPYEYRPGSRELRFSEEVRVNVSFVEGLTNEATRERVEISDDFRRLLSNTIINYETAMSWPEAVPVTGYDDGVWGGQFDHAYKVWVKDEGLYRLTYDDMLDFGFDVSVNPGALRLYASNGEELPKDLVIELDGETVMPLGEGLIEVPMNIHDTGDPRFDPGDYIEFYGHGSWYFQDNGTDFTFNKNQYTYYNVYWLVVGEGSGLYYTPLNGAPEREGLEPAYAYADRAHFEIDDDFYGMDDSIDQGEELWFWFPLEVTNSPYNSHSEPFSIHNVGRGASGIDGKLYARLRGLDNSHNTSIFLNAEDDGYKVIDEHNWPANDQLDVERIIPDINILYDGYNQIIVREGDGVPHNYTDTILFSEFEVEYPRLFIAEGDYIKFSNPPGETGWIEFLLSGFTDPDITIYDISNGKLINNYELGISDGSHTVRFQDDIQTERKWYVAVSDSAKSPLFDMARDVPSNIREHRKADILIVCYQEFYDNVIPLANMHRAQGYDVDLCKVDDVYDEFSNGLMDEYAIRNFVKYRYDDPLTRPSYLLLVGDTTYDYRDCLGNYVGEHRTFGATQVPTLYIMANQGHTASDNAFTCVDGDDNYGDLTVGRLSSYFENNIDAMVAKALKYGNSLPMGNWRNRIQILADNTHYGDDCVDGNGDFTEDAEDLDLLYFPEGYYNFKNYIEWLSRIDPEFIYKTPLNDRRELTREYIKPRMLEKFGSLITQFSGHGASYTWAHERLLGHNTIFFDGLFYDIYETNNGDYLPIVMQMACSNNHFDEYPTSPDDDFDMEHMDCMGEYLIYVADEGAIAATGSSRLGYEGSQADFNEGFFAYLFPGQVPINTPVTIGEAFLAGKMNSSSNAIWDNYTLLGDPALRIPVPTPGITAALNPALPKRGGVTTITGTVPNNFEGEIIVEAYDRPFYFKYVTSGYSDGLGGWIFVYEDAYRERLLTKAKGEVSAGNFSVDLPIPITAGWGYDPDNESPRDINDVKLKIYAFNEATRRDYMLGEDLIFAVEGEVTSGDSIGPLVELYVGDTNFRSGDSVDNSTELILRLNDESGILVSNYTENPDVNFLALTYQLDNETPIDISQFLEPMLDDYSSAELRYPIIIPDGTHTITVKVHDSFKNLTAESVQVTAGGELSLGNVLNCPNPFGNSGTYFTFTANKDLDSCAVKIYTVTGKLIQKIERFSCRAGYNEIFWDGRDRDGDEIANGVYYYKVIARSDSDIAGVKEKLIKLR